MKTLSQVLNKQHHLRLCNINRVSDRLLQRTNGDCFIAFNTLNDCYELHSISSFDEGCNSCNAVIPEEWLNWRIIEDFLANNHKKFGQELEDERNQMSAYLDRQEEKNQSLLTSGRIGVVQRTLGRRV